ncbi:MAG TPA: isoaspartyl peptidase/L-asparaginase [Candidatus Krumholzibacteria bacterium]|nr:isoaspartyl peptidase/L-asparaginase [Candidatus Krumholzibacteria bacterium]
MNTAVVVASLTLALLSLVIPAESTKSPDSPIALVIHGGAGTIVREKMTPEREAGIRAALAEALTTGYRILEQGGSSMDAVEAAICVLEDSPYFNAGRGSVFTSEGRNEMDAAIMDGATRKAGAVASVTGIKNPIRAARKVMEQTSHVMLVGEGAEKFAREQGLQFEDSAYFFTQYRWEELQKTKEQEKALKKEYGSLAFPHTHLGTVGAVAVDQKGNLAAATSTGGLTNKRWGRVGDSPIIGAGTYADNATCAVSCTGKGEVFIRSAAAHEVSALMRYEGLAVEKAAQRVVREELVELGGEGTGGLIAIDRGGRFAMEFNTSGMYRGYITRGQKPRTFIYREE